MKTVEVNVKGPGPGREAAVVLLQAAGLEVTAINDVLFIYCRTSILTKSDICN